MEVNMRRRPKWLKFKAMNKVKEDKKISAAILIPKLTTKIIALHEQKKSKLVILAEIRRNIEVIKAKKVFTILVLVSIINTTIHFYFGSNSDDLNNYIYRNVCRPKITGLKPKLEISGSRSLKDQEMAALEKATKLYGLSAHVYDHWGSMRVGEMVGDKFVVHGEGDTWEKAFERIK